MSLSVKINPADIRNVKSMLDGVKNGAPKVLSRSINKTLTGVKTDAAKELYKTMNMNQAKIKKGFKIENSTFSKLTGKFESRGKRISLMDFSGTRQTKKGISVKVRRDGSRKVVRYGFFSNGSAWRRKYKGAKKPVNQNIAYGALPKKYRLPIERLTAPGVEDYLKDDRTMKPVLEKAGERLSKNLTHETEFELSKLK